MKIGIYMTAYNRPELARVALASLAASRESCGLDWPITVSVDDATNQAETVRVAEDYADRVVRAGGRLGLHRHVVGLKRGAFADADIDAAVICVDDFEVTGHYLGLIKRAYEWCHNNGHTSVGMVGSRYFDGFGRPADELGDGFVSPGNYLITRECWEATWEKYKEFLPLVDAPHETVRAWLREGVSRIPKGWFDSPMATRRDDTIKAFNSPDVAVGQDAAFRMSFGVAGYHYPQLSLPRVRNIPNEGTHSSMAWFRESGLHDIKLPDIPEDATRAEFNTRTPL